jgi:hypothetical protein
MKRSLVTVLLLALVSTSAMSGEFSQKHSDSLGLSYVGVSVVIGVYGLTGAGAAILVGGSMAASATEKEIQLSENKRKQAAAKLLINDSQAFFQTGEMSLSLKDAIDQLKNQTIDLSDLEALDILNESALTILE